MDSVKDHWITALAVLAVVFLLFMSVASLMASDPEYESEDRVTAALAGLFALALIGGLWGVRTGRIKLWVAHTLIVPSVVFVGMFFWLFFVPTIAALALLYAGVIRRGLEAELRLG